MTSVTEPVPSRDHTERLLAAMGAPIEHAQAEERSCVTIRPGPLDPIVLDVPGDFSSAAPFLALAAARAGSEVVVDKVGLNPTRTGLLSLLGRMGARVDIELQANEPEPVGLVRVAGAPLVGIDVDPAEVPLSIDELPLIAVLGTQAEGVTRLRGAAELRVKESDRIEAVATGLRAMGARVETTDDGLAVEGPTPLRGAVLDAAGDHRIAMALAVAAILADRSSQLDGAEWVTISYPDFFDDLAAAAASEARA